MQRPSTVPRPSAPASDPDRPRLAVIAGKSAAPVAQLRFALPRATPVAAYVINSSNQIVHTLCQEHLEPGEHVCGWDGRDANGNCVPPGTYTLRLEAASRVLCVRMVTLR